LILRILLCNNAPRKEKLKGDPTLAQEKRPMKSFLTCAALLTLLLFTGASAQATTLSLTDCDAYGCSGSDVFLTVEEVSGGYNVILSIDTTDYTGTEDGVVQAGFKAIGGISDDDVTLVSFTDGSWSDATVAGINGGGGALCDGAEDPDFVCTSGYANIETDKIYTWTFFVEGGTLLDEWTIKFQYCNEGDTDCKGRLISAPGDPGNPVPEPSAALVFAAGLLAAAPKLRRRR
jgi:hypothetical protein